MAALALLLAGFLVRRTVGPATLHYLTHRPAAVRMQGSTPDLPDRPNEDNSAKQVETANSASERTRIAGNSGTAQTAPPAAPGNREVLRESDRRQLDEVLKRKLR